MSDIRSETESPLDVATPQNEVRTKAKRQRGKKSANKRPVAKPAKRSASKPVKKAAEKPAADQSNKKDTVIALMRRPKGAALTEIMKVTGWQKHTVRGFVSILGKKGGQRIESSKNEDERVYKITK